MAEDLRSFWEHLFWGNW